MMPFDYIESACVCRMCETFFRVFVVSRTHTVVFNLVVITVVVRKTIKDNVSFLISVFIGSVTFTGRTTWLGES